MSIAPQVSPAMEIAFAGFAAAIVEPPEACKLRILYNKFLDGIERESRSWRERLIQSARRGCVEMTKAPRRREKSQGAGNCDLERRFLQQPQDDDDKPPDSL